MIILTVLLVILISSAKSKSAQKRAFLLSAEISGLLRRIDSADSASGFCRDWNQAGMKVQQFSQINLFLFPKEAKANYFRFVSVWNKKQYDYQWLLRNAIERMTKKALHNLVLYRNSQEHKERVYDLFCADLDSVYIVFSDETRAFADKAITSVYNASGVGKARHPLFLPGKPSANEASRQLPAVPSTSPPTSTSELLKVDRMDGHAFEYWCADLLRKNGFTNVSVTQGSGDQGVDILAEKGGIKYAIQCKCYANDLGNKPIQEVHAGRDIYHCHVGVVMTNSHFTRGAIDAANGTHVLLWDREKLKEMIDFANKTMFPQTAPAAPKLDPVEAKSEEPINQQPVMKSSEPPAFRPAVIEAVSVPKSTSIWNIQAVRAAKDLLEYDYYSRDKLIEELIEEGFTKEQATYAADHLDD